MASGKNLTDWALLLLISWAPFFLTQLSSDTSIWMRLYFELFILPGMTDVRLNCKTYQLYIHCTHLQSINAFWQFSAGRPFSLQPFCSMPGIHPSQPLRAYTILHKHFSPLMWSSTMSSNMIYLNRSRNIGGTSGWFAVLSWTLPGHENKLLLISLASVFVEITWCELFISSMLRTSLFKKSGNKKFSLIEIF